MSKATAKEICDLYQERFDKTAAHVAEILCKSLDKKLRELSAASVHTKSQFTVQIKELLSKKYELRNGMLEWRYKPIGQDTESGWKLIEQIMILVKNYYTDWRVTLNFDLSGCAFLENELQFDAKFVAQVRRHRPVDLETKFNKCVDDMVQFFVQHIRQQIDACYGRQSIQEPIIAGIIYYSKQLSLSKEDAKKIFQAVKSALAEDGWSVCIKTSKSLIDTLYPNTQYVFEISPQ